MMDEKFTPPKVLDMGEPKWLNVDGINTRYFDKGEGERIVAVNGKTKAEQDKAKALESIRKAVEMDPKRVYYRRQMAGIEAGNPAAPRPDENDDE